MNNNQLHQQIVWTPRALTGSILRKLLCPSLTNSPPPPRARLAFVRRTSLRNINWITNINWILFTSCENQEKVLPENLKNAPVDATFTLNVVIEALSKTDRKIYDQRKSALCLRSSREKILNSLRSQPTRIIYFFCIIYYRNYSFLRTTSEPVKRLLLPQGFGLKTRGGTLGFPACIHVRNFKM